MKESARYVKIVEWSDEDQCFVGQCPGVIGPCCHGTDEAQVYVELCQIVDEWIEILKKDGKPLPPQQLAKT
jgi:predicted RNase H-like HicB family nuclease